MELENLRPAEGAVKKPKRVGRGLGSGFGRTSGRGHKGQKSRSGFSRRRGFEGGQMPLQRRLPKRGFTNIFRKEMACVNLRALGNVFEAGSTVDPTQLAARGLVRKKRAGGVKILGDGDIDRALTVRANAFSASARSKIEKAGGTCEVI